MRYLKLICGLVFAVCVIQAHANNYGAAKADSYFEEYPEEYDNYAWQREESVDQAQLDAEEAVRAAEEEYNREHPKVIAACVKRLKFSESRCEDIVPEMSMAECMMSLNLETETCRQRY